MIQQQPPMQQRLPMGIVPPRQQPQVPPQMAGSPQFGAARQVVMEGLPQIYQQLEELVTLKAVDLVNSADRQEAMDGDPGQSNMQVAENSIKGEAEQGIINALAGMQRQQPMGLPQLPANNMAVRAAAQGGIVGFARGGLQQESKEKSKTPQMGAIPPSVVGDAQIRADAKRYQALQKAIENATTPEIKQRNQMLLQDLIRDMGNSHATVMQYIDSMQGVVQPRAQGMAGGGIVSFRPGGSVEIDGTQVPFYQQQSRDFTEPSGQQKDFEDIVSWIQTYNVEPEIANTILRNPNSVAGDQIDVLKQVLVGAGNRTLDEINRMLANFPSLSVGENVNPRGERDFSRLEDSPEPQGLMALGQRRAGENEERRRANRSQPMTPEEIARQRVMAGLSSGVEPPLSDFQQSLVDAGDANVGQQLSDAEQRLTNEQRASEDSEIDFLNRVSGESDRMNNLENARMYPPNLNIVGNVKDFVEESGLGSLDYEGFARSVLPKATDVSTISSDPSLGRYLGAFASDMVTGPGRVVDAVVGSDFISDLQEGYHGEDPGTRDDTVVATEVIETSPTVEEPIPPSGGVSRADIDAGARLASQAEDEAQTEIARTRNFVEASQDLQQTPVESSLYDKKLEEIMKRSKSPIRTIATFLQGYGEDKFAGASKAMRAAEAQYDNMEIDLLKLQEANRISQQQFDINMQKIKNEREQLRITEDRYITQGENEAARIAATQKYYDVLAEGNQSRTRIALEEAVQTYIEDSIRLHADIAAIEGINFRQVDKLLEDNTQAYNEARRKAVQNYRNAVESGLFRSAGGGAGQPIDAAQYFN